MINKKIFLELITLVETYHKEINKWDDFGLEIFEKPICEIPWSIIDICFKTNFNEDGVDWINWYLFERCGFNGEAYPYYDENDNPIYINTAEDLWNLVKDYQINLYLNENASIN